jgi:hypothetical protein
MTPVFHYTSFNNARTILTRDGINPALGQPICFEFRPGQQIRGIRALVEPDPPSWRTSPAFGDYMALLMRLIVDRLCLEILVADDEAIFVERATIEAYMHGVGALGVAARLPPTLRYFRRESAESAMWDSRVLPSNRAAWATYLLPKAIITATIPPSRIRICPDQPYLLDPRWDNATTRTRASQFEIAPFPEIWQMISSARLGCVR